MLTAIVFILVLGILIFVHEAGHFFAARFFKIKVEEFAFGFPPRLFAKKKGETTYALNALPIGGYVKLLGEDSNSNDPRSFGKQKARVRLAVIVAGVFMNIVLAIFILWIGFMIGMVPLVSKASELGGTHVSEVLVAGVLKDSPADQIGLKNGDILVGFDKPEDLQAFTKNHKGETIELEVKRGGVVEKKSVPLPTEAEVPLGVQVLQITKVKLGVFPALQAAVIETGRTMGATFSFLGGFFQRLLTTGTVSEEVSGPVGIYSVTGQAVQLGFTYVLQLMASLSINLALLNILPFPALDGGRGLFVFLEGVVRRKVVRAEIENAIHMIGFILLLVLITLITYKDILKLR